MTRMPAVPNSPARWRVNAITPAFAAAYAAEDFAAWRAADEAIVMMTPALSSSMPGRNADTVRNVDVRSVSTTSCQCAPFSVSVATGMPFPPANAARISARPNSSVTLC